jgi:pyruvate formate lyase activating enzyme
LWRIVEPKATGRIFNIQRYSIHDGAGIRTLIFLKGCPLRCQWCSNPESQKSAPELGFIESTCPGVDICGAPCVEACPEEAVSLNARGKPFIDRAECSLCGECAEVCRHDALKLVGREMTVAEVLVEVEKDRPFYRRSGGGITVGGGEPLAQPGFTVALLEAAQDEYLHTALETSGHVRWEQLEAVLGHVDQLHYDVKHMDPERHRELTGQSNELILNNLERVLSIKEPQDVVIRIPVIPGCNDDVENISESAKFVASLGYTQIELMPYHMMGVSKYGQYGMAYRLDGLKPAQEENLRELKEIVSGFGLQEMTGRI